MANRGALEETRKTPVETSKETSKTSTKGVSNAEEDSFETKETGPDSTGVFSSIQTSTKASKTSTKGISCVEGSPGRKETGVVLFQPEARLNPDVLELIFRHLNFKELLAAELVGAHISFEICKKNL